MKKGSFVKRNKEGKRKEKMNQSHCMTSVASGNEERKKNKRWTNQSRSEWDWLW